MSDRYGTAWAPWYDQIYTAAEPETIRFLLGYSGRPGRALELGVGTGRIAIPLTAAGVAVTGIESSAEMIRRLAAKQGGERIEMVQGDFADVEVADRFPLVYLPFNTLFLLADQQRQVECLLNVSRALEPGGAFVLDCFVPDPTRFDGEGTRMGVSSIASDRAHAYEMSIHDPVEQRVVSHHVRRLEDGSTVVLPVTVRYAWPPEIDLMARLAGLRLEDRFGWYDRRPFTAGSRQHVSVYRKPA